ncbi:hypothetical protein CRENBAI_017324 [Crenichthys baileyi]|uniref:Uncharacterized protein n=1 Tax=Crenichthys baileyi TaxID=28760 RepID=A0AAV9SPG0_9TELE
MSNRCWRACRPPDVSADQIRPFVMVCSDLRVSEACKCLSSTLVFTQTRSVFILLVWRFKSALSGLQLSTFILSVERLEKVLNNVSHIREKHKLKDLFWQFNQIDQ